MWNGARWQLQLRHTLTRQSAHVAKATCAVYSVFMNVLMFIFFVVAAPDRCWSLWRLQVEMLLSVCHAMLQVFPLFCPPLIDRICTAVWCIDLFSFLKAAFSCVIGPGLATHRWQLHTWSPTVPMETAHTQSGPVQTAACFFLLLLDTQHFLMKAVCHVHTLLEVWHWFTL